MKVLSLAVVVLLTTSSCVPVAFAADKKEQSVAAQVSPAAAQQLHRIFDDYSETTLREWPTYASFIGDRRYNDKLEDLSLPAVRRRRSQKAEFLTRLEAIDPTALSERDRISRAVLLSSLRTEARGDRLLGDLPLEFGSDQGPMPVTQMEGPQFWLPMVVQGTRFEDIKDYEDYLKRLAAVPIYVAQLTDALRAGMTSGWIPPKITLRNLPEQFTALADAEPARNPMFAPFKSFPPKISDSGQAALRHAAEAAIRTQVAPAFADLKLFLQTRYLPAATEEIAASKLPGGMAYYDAMLQLSNTTQMSAKEIHEVGLREVARIETEMAAVQRRAGFDGSRADFLKFLWSDPKFFCNTPAEMLAAYRDIAKRIDPQLPKLFRELPRLPYGVRPMAPEEGDNAEHYVQGAEDGSRAGYFEANTNNLRRVARWQMTDLVMHEAVPGHHLQVSRGQELSDLPTFQRRIWFAGFGEGWAVYAETLGDQIGMYDDPLDKYGQLSAEVWRAARLVVDTGMHAFGWSRERALDYLKAHTTQSPDEIVSEVDRYIVWPGQATAYKIGQLHIVALRDKAQKALGGRFDLRAFHNAVIDNGTMPLDVLDEVIDRWIAGQKAAQN